MGLTSAPDERLRRHRARARPSDSCPELRPNPRPDETTGRPDSRAPRRRMNAVVASLLPAPLRKRRDDVIPRLLRRLVLTSGLASLAAGPSAAQGPRPASITACQQRAGAAGALARRTSGVANPLARNGEPTRLPGGRPSSLTSRRSARAVRGERRVAREDGRPPGRPRRPPSSGRRVGRSRRASGASPGVSTALKAGMTPSRRFRSAAGRSEATTASYGSSRWQDAFRLSLSWSWVRLHSLSSQRGAARPRPVSSWHRTRRARSRRRRVAPVDGGERLGRALGHGSHVSAR